MKTAEAKSPIVQRPQTRTNGSFFNKEGEGAFFSSESEMVQTMPFFDTRSVSDDSKAQTIQAKLTVGKPNDKYEIEADAMADKVVQRLAENQSNDSTNLKVSTSPSFIQKKCAACAEEVKLQKKEGDKKQLNQVEKYLQRKPIFEIDHSANESTVQRNSDLFQSFSAIQKQESESEEETIQEKEEEQNYVKVQRKPIFDSDAPTDLQTKSNNAPNFANINLENRLNSSKGGGSPLPVETQTSMGSAFGADFNGVRIHTDSSAIQMNKELNAQAFTHGSNIYFNEGKYDLNSSRGNRLLAHELTHTIQQVSTIQKTDDSPDAKEAGACPNYEANEVFHSRREPGILPSDVSSLSGDKLLVADMGVGRSNIRASSQAETLFQDKLNDFESNCAIHLKIHGFSDCSGPEDNNVAIRERRANSLKSLIGPHATPRISETSGAPLAEFVTSNSTKEDRAKNRSSRISFQEGFWLQQEAIDTAIAGDTEIQSALTELGTSSIAREKNVPEYLTHKSITLEPLTPTHNTLLSAVSLEFFTGKVDYSQIFTLPRSTRFKTYASNSKVAVQSRDLPCTDRSLSRGQIKERILEAITEIVHLEAHGSSAFEQYRGRFNARFHITPYSTMDDSLDLSLNSKGPRTQRSRNLFNVIYDELLVFKSEYDSNAGGIKEKVDTYFGPEGLNTINSPRLEALIQVFNAAATPVADPDYPDFKTQVTTTANSLDSQDTTAIDTSQEWQTLFVNKLPDLAKRTEIKNIIDQGPSSRPSPPSPPPSPPSPPGTTPPSGTISPAAQTFLDNIQINGPNAPISSNIVREPADLQPESNQPNPDLTFKTEFRLTPTSKVAGSPNSPKRPWTIGNQQGELFQPNIVVDGIANMTANLHLHDLPSGAGPASAITSKSFTVNDNRLNHVKSVWDTNLLYLAAQFMDFYNVGDTVNYRNGGQNFKVKAALPAGETNPDLNLSVNARVKRGGSMIASISNPVNFPSGNRESGMIALNFLEPNTIPSGGDPITVEVELLDTNVVQDTKTISITIHAAPAYTKAQAESAARSDQSYYTGTLLPAMSAAGGIQSEVAEAVTTSEANGGITLEPLGIRHDSVDLIERLEGAKNPAKVAYFAGTSYTDMSFWRRSRSSFPHLIVAGPNAAGFSTSCCPDLGNNLIVLNRTYDVVSGSTRSDDSLKQLLTHEAVHRLDNRPNSNTPIEQYKTEFRAYWMDGRYGDPNTPLCPGTPTSCTRTGSGCHDARYDASCSTFGPKSPRARAIFMSLYGDDLYDFVKTNYDNNTDGFREQVDRYLFPDGINLRVSVHLERLRRLIDSYSGANFAILHTEVRRFMGLISPPPSGGALNNDDKAYISQSRAWRDLVERKVTDSSDQRTLKTTLAIPT